MLGLLLLLDLGATPPIPCAPATILPQVQQALGIVAKKDPAGAKAALAAVAACPATSFPAFLARVVRAEIAVGEGDWSSARTALDGVGVHPETALSAHVGFLRLRADQGLGDAAAFARDRAALVAANDAVLAAAGRRVESFRAGAATVTGYEAVIDQRVFHRTIEFIVVPDDPAAYPAAILLTDDRNAVVMAAQMAKPGEVKREHVWFFDRYTCDVHSTLTPPIATDTPPTYAELRARVVTLAADPALVAATPPPEHAACFAGIWILPGLNREPANGKAPVP